MSDRGDHPAGQGGSTAEQQTYRAEVRWVDPGIVPGGTLVVVNVLWSPYPAYNEGNSWLVPPDPPQDTEIGSWTVGSRMVPSWHDGHPRRWSRQIEGLALLFQDRPGHLLVDTGQQVWAVPHGLADVIGVLAGTALAVDLGEGDSVALRAPCASTGPGNESCVATGPHPTHRSAYPFVWWENTEWREPTPRLGLTVADLAAAVPPETPAPSRPPEEEIVYEEG
jgi:hypothetical protein